MKDVELQKLKLAQKKNRLLAEETKLKLKLRKSRTRQLIELGGLIVKAELDNLPTNTFYGALLSLKDQLDNNPSILDSWTNIGKTAFDQEQQTKTAVIITFAEMPSSDVRNILRQHNLRYNRFRQEWYGELVINIEEMKTLLQNEQVAFQLTAI